MTEALPANIVVADASPIILLGGIGRLELLRDLYARVAIPPAVRREAAARGETKAGAAEVAASAWLETVPVRDPGRAAALCAERSLGLGEGEAIRLALELKAPETLIDERRARREAERLGLEVTGTLGVLIDAQRRGLVADARPLVERVARLSGRVAPRVLERALAEIETLRAAG